MPKELVNVKKHPVDGSEIRRSVEDGSLSRYLHGFHASQVVIAGFLNHQQSRRKKMMKMIPS